MTLTEKQPTPLQPGAMRAGLAGPRARLWGALLLLAWGGCSSVSKRAGGTTAPAGVQAAPAAEAYPVVLLHGLAGFRALGGVADYFFQVPTALREEGMTVFTTRVPPWAPVDVRAQHLARELDQILKMSGARKLHLIAHSMGGLDARYAISKLGYGPRVASLTTVGTPHRGSPVADAWHRFRIPVMDGLRDGTANLFALAVGNDTPASNTADTVWSLTVANARKFNDDVRDDPAVRYYSFAGRTLGHNGIHVCDDAVFPNPAGVELAPPELTSTAMFLGGPDPLHSSANDGLVQVVSAKWGVWLGCAPANHMRLVGHMVGVSELPMPWDHKAFYVRWATLLTNGQARLLENGMKAQ